MDTHPTTYARKVKTVYSSSIARRCICPKPANTRFPSMHLCKRTTSATTPSLDPKHWLFLSTRFEQIKCLVNIVNRIISHIKIHLIFIANRIGLQEPSKPRLVHPYFIMVQAQLRQPHLAGVAEAALIGQHLWNTVCVIPVDRYQITVVIRMRDDAPLMVCM